MGTVASHSLACVEVWTGGMRPSYQLLATNIVPGQLLR